MRWIFCFFSLPLFAVYVGNPADPALMNTGVFSSSYPFFKFTSGYVYDYTSNKDYIASNGLIKRFGLHSQLASFSLIFIERLQLFGTAGGSKETLSNQSIYDAVLESHTNYHFSWSAGTKVILLQWGQTYLGCDFTYFAIPSSAKSFFKLLNRVNLPIEIDPNKKQELSLKEWQLSCALSSRFWFITPYAGGNYLHSRLHALINYHNELNWGYFYGVTLSLTGRFQVNFEQRFRSESAYTFATTMVF